MKRTERIAFIRVEKAMSKVRSMRTKKGDLILCPEEVPQSAAEIVSKHHSLVDEDDSGEEE